jgi:hypothetical protein
MPNTADLVDDLRAWLGKEAVDAAIVAGQRVRREWTARVQRDGQQAADAWLRRQSCPQGLFWAREGSHEVGVRRP